MPLYVADYIAKTGHLTTVEHGAYMLLIMQYWVHETLPDNDKILAQVARMPLKEWRKIRPCIAPYFQVEHNSQWRHERIDDELKKASELREKKRKAGIASANARSTGVQQVLEQNTQQTCNQSPPQQQSTKIVNLNGFVVGRGSERKKNTAEYKLSSFQQWLAEGIGKDGWRIVGEAADPESKNYETALHFCKSWAEENGKGWPWNWPKAALDG